MIFPSGKKKTFGSVFDKFVEKLSNDQDRNEIVTICRNPYVKSRDMHEQ